MIAGTQEKYEQAKESLERMQKFDASGLPREKKLGEDLSFKGAVEPARRLIDLYKRLSVTALEDFPDDILDKIQDWANSDHSKFKKILEFNPSQSDPTNIRRHLIAEVEDAYKTAFDHLHPYIAYSLHRSADFQRLDAEARATVQSVKEESEKLMGSLKEHENSAEKILEEVRKVAAEQGVSQQALYFEDEYEHHNKEANRSKRGAVLTAGLLIGVAVVSLYLHKIPGLEPKTIYDAIQLTVSKILIFSTVAYLLFLSVRDFLNHKHNAIVNKHRRNALLTYQALVEASGDAGVRDAVLLQASSCIFSPQSTGYAASHETDVSRQKSLVEILSKSATNTAQDVGK